MFTICAFASLCLNFTQQPMTENKTPDKAAVYFDQAFKATKLSDLQIAAGKIRTELSPQQKKRLLVLLVDDLGSEKELQCTEENHAGYRLRTRSGRACWLISKIIYDSIDDPAAAKVEDREPRLRHAFKKILNFTSADDPIRGLTTTEKLKLAKDKATPVPLLIRFADDPDYQVRLAVLFNVNLPLEYVNLLVHDPDPRVRDAISKAEESAELPKDDVPKDKKNKK